MGNVLRGVEEGVEESDSLFAEEEKGCRLEGAMSSGIRVALQRG
jgi:hypothetical protein